MSERKSEERSSRSPVLTRRRLVLGGSLLGGALVVGYTARNIGAVASGALSIGAQSPDPSAFGPFIKIDEAGWVTVVNKHQEMGQGTHAGLAAIVAEELDADWEKVRLESSPANAAIYKNTVMGIQATAGSSAIAGSWDQLRHAGAAARAMFVQAAAGKWGVPVASINVRSGVVYHAGSDRQETFVELLADAAKVTPPANPTLKDPKDYKLIGTDLVRRKDSQSKSNGTARYTQDVQLPRMLTAMVAHPPRFGGKLASFDAGAARRIPGVVDVFEIGSGVAVVAEDTWSARRGRDALKITWDDTKAETRSSHELRALYRDIANGKTDVTGAAFHTVGNVERAFDGELFEASFDFPYLAHAAMEPMNCVARVDGRKVKLMFASQLQTMDQINAALTAISLPGMVEIETLPAGGSFGRRGIMTSDYVVECVNIARHVGGGRPVKLVWTREDDMTSGYYRPMVHHRISIKCGDAGLPAAWRHHAVAQALIPFGANEIAVEGIKNSPYLAVAAVVDGKVFTPKLAVPPAFWRSVGNSHTAMVLEHTVDQLARRAKRDPAEYRRAIYAKAGDVRRLAVLELVCKKAGWAGPIEAGWARGLAVHECFGTVVAQVAEVSMRGGIPKVRRVVCAVDCGVAVAPNQIAAQMEGGVCFGLSAALYGRITLDRGVPQETNFDGYRVLRMDEAPSVETYIVPSRRNPTGVGEPGVPLIAPAVANAILSLTGRATTGLPFVT
ncbi:xanthine dehydrogenase family protein molybdopterin-binding subunit [Bradyrhizobium sp. 31Argb]|uniref:xanthine dehydrogenase family protein molybdopterin-binding subunit n=1 Tax=unclassified Bradyrhizobium TaxID=2631580 RepID=UPI00102E72EE|nr:xanthine dehydrogenase family protein molybdopterin-binding subunit [Bradyrhizobium sp. Leo170]TAI66491.1 isoquinoline 1-oxidoreductase [Bradyrhizobium sp. Leo170]